MLKLLRHSVVPLIHPCLWILSQEPQRRVARKAERQILCYSVLRLSSCISTVFHTPSCPAPALSIFSSAQQCSLPLLCLQFSRQPAKILMNPIWPLVAVSAASLTLLPRGAAFICLSTSAHVGHTSHDADMCCTPRQLFPTLRRLRNQGWNRDADLTPGKGRPF